MRRAWRTVVLVALVAGFLAGERRARAETEEQLIGVLTSSAPAQEKAWACRELKRAGTVKAVPALAALLSDPAVAHSARYALESMPGPEASAALQAAVGKTSGAARLGVVASLGVRRDREAVPVLAALLGDGDAAVVEAAALSLGDIGTAEAARELTAALGRGAGRPGVAEGLLRCADGLAAAGRAGEAAGVYGRLAKADVPRAVRRGALGGVVRAAGEKQVEVVRGMLAGEDAEARAAAAGQFGGLAAERLLAVANDVGRLPAVSQAAVVTALGQRGDRKALGAVTAAAGSPHPEVQRAALEALGRLGGAEAVPPLVQALFAGAAPLEAARRALEELPAAGVDERLVAVLREQTEPRRRAVLVEVLDARGSPAAVAALVQEAAGESVEVRAKAMAALGRLATPEEVPGMVRGLFKAARGPEREAAEKAVAAACQQVADPDRRAELLLAAAGQAGEAEKAALLPLLARTGSPKALGMVQGALGSANRELYEEGLRALASWPDAGVSEQLLTLARTAARPEHKQLAVAGLARVATGPGSLTPEKKLEYLKQAMALAARDEERRVVLERASLVRLVETLRFVLPYLDRAGLSEQACRTVVELAHHRGLRLPNKKEFDPALQKVIQVSREPGIQDRARKYLEGL